MKTSIDRYLLLVVFLISSSRLFQQNLNYIQYNTNNSSLTNDIIYQIRQDDQDYLWICTDDGLVRFDGHEMLSFNKGFASKYVIGFDIEHGKKWFCTWKGGIHLMEGDSVWPLRFVGQHPELSYSTNNIIVFNELIIAYRFRQYYYFKYDSVKKQIGHYSELIESLNGLYGFLPDTPGYLQFFKSTQQHKLFAWDSNSVYEFKDHKFVKLRGDYKITSLYEAPWGQLYVLSGNAIYKCDATFEKPVKLYDIPAKLLQNREVQKFIVLPTGNLCLATAPVLTGQSNIYVNNPNFYYVNINTSEIINLNKLLLHETLTCWLTTDKEGTIWMATDGQGLFHIFEKKYKHIGVGDSLLLNPHISVLHSTANDTLFIGTAKGLYLLTNSGVNYVNCPGMSHYDFVQRFYPLRNAGVAVSCKENKNTLFSLNRNGSCGPMMNQRGFCGNYVLSSNENGKLQIVDERTGRTYYQELIRVDVTVNWFRQDDGGNMWLGSSGGLWKFDPDSGCKKNNDPILKNIQINAMDHIKGVGLVLATNFGILVLGKDGKIRKMQGADGIAGTVNNFLFESPSSVWIGSQNGLYHLENGKLNIYKRRNGLISDDVSALAMFRPGQLVVGSSKGLTFFSIGESGIQNPPNIIAEEFRVNGKIIKLTDEGTEVDYNSIISLNYNAITFVYPELLEYQYHLKENDEWIMTHGNKLVFTNLKPGNYQLEVRARKYNSPFSTPLQFRFTVSLPWYRSLSAITLYGLSLVSITALIFYQRLRRQRAESVVKQELAELKLKALQAQLNPHFISNALNSIQYFILRHDEVSANSYLGRFSELTRLFLDASRSRFTTLARELELINHYLALEKIRFGNKFDYAVHVDSGIEPERIPLPGLLIQPFIENSINHGLVFLPASQTGLVKIDINGNGREMTIVVTDNGIGRKKSSEIYEKQKRPHLSASGNIMSEMQNAYNSLHGNSLQIVINDLYTHRGEAMGTEVRILLNLSNYTLKQ